MPELSSGTLIDGRYRVLSRLGSGGMADVFLAEDEQLGRKVALKLLHRRFSEDQAFVERFRREAQSAAGLQHPNVVGVYDRGSYDGTYYIAMEYLPGRSLKQLIRDEAPLDPVRAIDITIQILKAARFAHRHGVIHRDLKPHNVIVDESGHVKVTDFGIARAGASDMTETGSIMGTAQYLSPEQAQGHAVSAGSDLYAVAVVLYEMLTGRVPFDGEAAVTIALKHVSEAPTAPTRINAAIPSELEQVVMWGLNKDAVDRPRDADQFIAALEAARGSILATSTGQRTASMAALAGVGLPVAAAAGATSATRVTPVSPAPEALPIYDVVPGAAPPSRPPEEPRDRSVWPWLALLFVLLLLAGGAAAYLLTRPAQRVVPPVGGENINTARTVLQNAGFAVAALYVANQQSSGTVIGENPAGGTKADKGSTVTLTVSSGPGAVNIPSVVGESAKQAKETLAKQGLKVGSTVQESSDQITSGKVIGTDPGAGQSVPVGTQVTLLVSSGPMKVAIPGVTGESQAQAKSDLEHAGFQVSTTTQTSSTATPGNVIDQNPAGGTQAAPGTTVTIIVAQAPTTASVPSVKGQSASAATSALKGAGFKVVQQTKTVKRQDQNGIVVAQSPAGGSTVKKGSTVTITIGQYTPAASTTPTTTTPTTPTTTPTAPTPPTTPAG